MAEKRYSIPENFRGNDVHTPQGVITIDDKTTQKQLKYLREEIGMQDIQVGEKAMSLAEEVKVMEKDLDSLKAKLAKQSKGK